MSGLDVYFRHIFVEINMMSNLFYGTDVVRRCVERDEAGEGADCGRPRDQELAADMAERSSVPEELVADMAERSSVHGILTADRAEKSSVPGKIIDNNFASWLLNI